MEKGHFIWSMPYLYTIEPWNTFERGGHDNMEAAHIRVTYLLLLYSVPWLAKSSFQAETFT